MEKTLIVSDIHLSDLKPEITQYFLGFLKTLAGQAQYLYILGDLFDYWIGDEEIKKPSASEIVKSLKEVSKSGTDIFLLHGNRDFLLGEKLKCQGCKRDEKHQISFETNDGTFSGFVSVEVKNKVILNKLLKKLKSIEGIEKVSRK